MENGCTQEAVKQQRTRSRRRSKTDARLPDARCTSTATVLRPGTSNGPEAALYRVAVMSLGLTRDNAYVDARMVPFGMFARAAWMPFTYTSAPA